MRCLQQEEGSVYNTGGGNKLPIWATLWMGNKETNSFIFINMMPTINEIITTPAFLKSCFWNPLVTLHNLLEKVRFSYLPTLKQKAPPTAWHKRISLRCTAQYSHWLLPFGLTLTLPFHHDLVLCFIVFHVALKIKTVFIYWAQAMCQAGC